MQRGIKEGWLSYFTVWLYFPGFVIGAICAPLVHGFHKGLDSRFNLRR